MLQYCAWFHYGFGRLIKHDVDAIRLFVNQINDLEGREPESDVNSGKGTR